MRYGWIPGLVLAALVGSSGMACGGDDADDDVRLDVADTETTGEVAADADADVTPETTPDVAPDVEPDALPDVVPDGLPDVVPDGLPDVVPDGLPDVVPDVEPETHTETHVETGEGSETHVETGEGSETHVEGGEGRDGTREDAGTGVSCDTDPLWCDTAADCTTFSDYTNPDCCSCDPYNVACVPAETPTCTCFVDPCLGHTADCVEGRCVVL